MPDINKRPHSFRFVVVWIFLLIIGMAFQSFIFELEFPLAELVTFSGAISIAYLGVSYGFEFQDNKDRPKGQGDVKYYKKYKGLAITWTCLVIYGMGLTIVRTDAGLPMQELIGS